VAANPANPPAAATKPTVPVIDPEQLAFLR
jgi:hypothetical protein